jgi:DNA-binding beta-propeller fold protein YncE
MSFRRVSWVAAIVLVTWLEISCGQIYRPVVIPINITPPNPANFHAVFSIAVNAPYNPGTAFQIDVSGDSDIGSANMGINPTHAAILPNNARVFVASAGGDLCPAGADVVTAFSPAADSPSATGLGPPTTFTLPNNGATQSADVITISEPINGNVVTISLSAPLSNAVVGGEIVISGVSTLDTPPQPSPLNGCFPISSVSGTTIQYVTPTANLTTAVLTGSGGTAAVPMFCRYIPVYLASSQNNAMYVANYGAEGDPNCNVSSTDSVAYLNTTTNAVGNIAYLPAASHPIAMVETTDTQNLYVLTQGSNSVIDLSPSDLSTRTTIPVGNTPAWATLRPDGQRLYVITQGDGQLYTINTATNTVIPGSPQAVGGNGANFVIYDKSRNRLYVTNPNSGSIYIFDASTDPPSPVGSATGAISIPAPPICATAPCSAVMPSSIAALPDGTRFYVASYVTACSQSNATGCVVPAPCPDGVTAPGCVIPQVTVYDAGTLAVKTTIFPLLAAVSTTTTGLTASPYALTPVPFCAPVLPYAPVNQYNNGQLVTPASARFRMSAAASVDGSRVYASMCDGGSVAIVDTTTSTTATGVNTSDNLVTDLLAPFSAGAPQANGEPLPQSPVFLLAGQ